jgi:hypothetical protein
MEEKQTEAGSGPRLILVNIDPKNGARPEA